MMKGGGHGNMHAGHGGCSGSGGGRRGWNVYLLTLILLVIFGITILGLMGLQRMRERNVSNHLIKEKEDQILSLHLLLQKEREHVQEDKRKFHEMKMKMYSLRAQKTELNKRLLEMESTVSSLKEEQKTIESAFEEKQNEAKLFRERYRQVKDQIPRVNALTEMLQQKEAEIEDLKHRLHFSAKEYTSGNENKQESGEISRSERLDGITNDVSRYRQMESSTRNERLDEIRGEMIRKEQFEKLENSQERSVEKGRSDPQNGESFDVGKNKKNEHETEMNGDVGNEELKPRNEDREAHFGDDRRLEIEGDIQSKRSSNSEASGDRELGVHRGGVKLELQESSHSGSNGYRGNSDQLDRAKGNRWRAISEEIKEKWNYGSNGATITRNQRFVEGKREDGNRFEEGKTIKQAKIENPHMGLNVQNESVSRNQQSGVADKISNGKQHNVKAKSRGYTRENTGQNIEESPAGLELWNSRKLTDDMSRNAAKAEKVEMSQQAEKGLKGILTNSNKVKSHVSHNEVPNDISGSSNQGTVQHLEKHEQSKEQGFIIKQQMGNKNDDNPGQTKVVKKNEDPEDIDMQDFEDTDLGTSNSKETVSRAETDSEED